MAETWKKFTVTAHVAGQREKRTELTAQQVDKIRAVLRSVKCTHTDPCNYPFRKCSAGFTMVVEEE